MISRRMAETRVRNPHWNIGAISAYQISCFKFSCWVTSYTFVGVNMGTVYKCLHPAYLYHLDGLIMVTDIQLDYFIPRRIYVADDVIT